MDFLLLLILDLVVFHQSGLALSVAKGMKFSNNVNLFGFINSNLKRFDLENIELLIKWSTTKIN